MIAEITRVLKPGGWFFAKMFDQKTTGIMTGVMVEDGTMKSPEFGPMVGCGIVHAFSEEEIRKLLSSFRDVQLDTVHRTDKNGQFDIFEWIVQARMQ